MKRILALVLALAMVFALAACGSGAKEAAPAAAGTQNQAAAPAAAPADGGETAVDRGSKIGVMCSPVSWGEENYRMLEKYMKQYGEDRFIVNTLPEDSDLQTQITQAQAMANDPDCSVIIIDEEITGSIAAMQAAKAVNPDIVCIAVNLNEEPAEIAQAANLACGKSAEGFCREVVNAAAAKELDAVVLLIPVDVMGNTMMVERMGYLEQFCGEAGIVYETLVLPGQQDSNNRAALEQAAKEGVINKTNEYGDKVGFFVSGAFGYIPALTGIIEAGKGYLLAIGDPGPFAPAYADVFGITAPEDHVLDAEWTNAAISEKVKELGLEGHFANWKFSFLSCFMAASIEYALAYQAGEVGPDDAEAWVGFLKSANNLTDDDFVYEPLVVDGVTYNGTLLFTGSCLFYGENLGV